MASEVKVDKLSQKGSSGIVISDDIKLSSGKAIKNAAGTALLGEDGALGSGVTGYGSGRLVGVAYGGANANTNNVTVADNTTYDIYASAYNTLHEHILREYWTAVVDGSGSVTLTDLTAFDTNVLVSSPGANLIRMDVASGGGYSVMLVFER